MYAVRNEKLAECIGYLEPLINQISDYALYMLDTTGGVLSWNAGAERLLGYTAQEIIGCHFSAFYTTEDLAVDIPRRVLETAARGGTYQEEGLTVRKDRTCFWATVIITALKDQEGNLQGFAQLTRDITERKTHEATLRAREAKYRAVYENSHDAILLTSPENGTILAANPAACQLFGYSEQELTSLRPKQVLDMTDARLAAAFAQRAAIGDAAAELTFIRKGGQRFDARASSKLFTDESGHQMSCTTIQDITEKKQAEEALRQSEERFRLIYKNAPLGIIQFDQNGAITSANQKFAEISGYAPEEAVGLTSLDLTLPEERDTGREYMGRLLSGKTETANRERRLLRRDGSTRWTSMTSQIIHDKQGKPQWGMVVIEDISEKRHAEEALRQSEERFRLLYESAPVGIIQFDQNGYLISANRKFVEIAGHSQKEGVIGFTHNDITLPEDRAVVIELGKKLLSGEIDAYSHERRMPRKDGSTIWVRVNARMMRDKEGKPRERIALYEDITERKQAEEALRQSEEQFRLLYENAPVGIIQVDQNGRLTSANPKFSEITGYPLRETLGFTHVETTLPEERATFDHFIEDMYSGRKDTFHHERRLLRKDGRVIWIRVSARMMPNKQGQHRNGMVLYEDITEQKQAQDALQQSEEKFRATFEHAPLGIAECTVDGRFIGANAKLVEMLGYTKDEIVHLTLTDLTHPTDLEKTLSNLHKLATGEAEFYVAEKRYIRKDHSFVWVSVTTSLAPIHGKPQYMIVAVEDITARKKAEEDLKQAIEASYHQANHDMLTGLANRASFNDRLKEALAYARRDGHLVAVHLLDLDRFKSINDTLGHHIGDMLLKDVAKRIKSNVRATDLAARLGGDEFVVIQTHLADPAAAGVLAGKLVEDLRRKYVLEDQEVQSGTSIGIALYPSDAGDEEDLVKQADLALYDAKHGGRFNYQFYRHELGAAMHEAQRIEQELVRALRENEFCLHYQPQFDLKNGRITGMEALLRWDHPTKGKLAAAAFIQDVESAKLMPSIGEWTLRTACRQYKAWVDAGLAVPLTLNLSSTQLRDPRLLETIKRILDETGLPPSLVQLEMRESVLWDPTFSKRLLTQMKENGLRLAFDDFGVEMTTLPSLDRFPLDAVRPGQGLVRKLPSQKRASAMLAAIIGVAHTLNMSVCADGIESASQLAAVKEQGCDSAQGYLLSSPLDANEMGRLIEEELAH